MIVINVAYVKIMTDTDSTLLWLTTNVKHKLYVNAVVMKFVGGKEYGRRCAIG